MADLDLDRLEKEGFVKALTKQEWEDHKDDLARQYRPDDPQGAAQVVHDYMLERTSDNVRIIVEQNTFVQKTTDPSGGLSTTVQYPQIAIVEHVPSGRRAACAVGDTDLILAVAEQVKEK